MESRVQVNYVTYVCLKLLELETQVLQETKVAYSAMKHIFVQLALLRLLSLQVTIFLDASNALHSITSVLALVCVK